MSVIKPRKKYELINDRRQQPINPNNPKYKQYHNQENILVGKGELPYIKEKGWITPCGHIFTNKQDAIQYATKLNKIIMDNALRIKQTKLKYI